MAALAAARLIGEIELRRGRYEEARSAFARAIAIEPDDERNRKGLVSALEKLGRMTEAERHNAMLPSP